MSITRVLCDKTKQCTAGILTPHERAVTLVWLSCCSRQSWVTWQQLKATATSNHNIVLHL